MYNVKHEASLHASYRGMPEYNYRSVSYSVSAYVRLMAPMNGTELCWTSTKWEYYDNCYHMSAAQPQRNINKFFHGRITRTMDTVD